MKLTVVTIITLLMVACATNNSISRFPTGYYKDMEKCHHRASKKFVVVAHGGAGNYSGNDPNNKLKKDDLTVALSFARRQLSEGAQALDVVEAVIRFLEDSGNFNAGKGATISADGIVELDASIMNGKTMKAGAVAAIESVKNPISVARAIMERTNHVMLVGKGAKDFAENNRFEIVPNSYFNFVKTNRIKTKFGTVGAVVLDRCGNLAAGTSTGGWGTKMPGRVGDSPIIGAGTFANQKCAISATGHGEYFIRHVVAYDICSRMKYKNEKIKLAAHTVIDKLNQVGGKGGVIAIDNQGNITTPFSTSVMLRGYTTDQEAPKVDIFRPEH